MHRFYVESPIEALGGPGAEVALSPEESAHAAKVLRLRSGEEVQLLDGGALYSAELTRVGDGTAGNLTWAKVLAALPSPESRLQVTLWQGLPKGDKLETIAQKATELGVWALWPVEMERSVAKLDRAGPAAQGGRGGGGKGVSGGKGGAGSGESLGPKQQRLRRIALEAAKQSGRAHVPEMGPPCGFAEALERVKAAQPPFDLVLVAWEEAEGLLLSQAVGEAKDLGRLLLVIGPEGGISPGECRQLQDVGGKAVTLGRRILRTETAGCTALAVLWASLGEM